MLRSDSLTGFRSCIRPFHCSCQKTTKSKSKSREANKKQGKNKEHSKAEKGRSKEAEKRRNRAKKQKGEEAETQKSRKKTKAKAKATRHKNHKKTPQTEKTNIRPVLIYNMFNISCTLIWRLRTPESCCWWGVGLVLRMKFCLEMFWLSVFITFCWWHSGKKRRIGGCQRQHRHPTPPCVRRSISMHFAHLHV